MMHSYDKNRACPACGDMDGCHIPGKVKRHRPHGEHYLSAPESTGATEAKFGQTFPKIVCLCGSTRFLEAFRKAEFDETLEGNIVLTIGCDSKSDAELFKGERGEQVKAMLDDLHKRKIDHCDEVFVLNVGGYIGSSTRSEIEYAKRIGKPIRYLEQE